jgi:toxin ParE1/3/4
MNTSRSRLLRTSQADLDLIDIWTYISLFNPQAADNLLDLLDQKSAALAENPYLGMARGDLAKGIRHFPVGDYLILYRVIDDGVEVVRYVHGRRRLRDLVR